MHAIINLINKTENVMSQIKEVFNHLDPRIIKKYDDNGKLIYSEFPDGSWIKNEWNDNGYQTKVEDSTGYWKTYKYEDGHDASLVTYYENSEGTWVKTRYDKEGNISAQDSSYNS